LNLDSVIPHLRDWGRRLECDMYWRPKCCVVYISLIGPEIERIKIENQLKELVIKIHRLPNIHCSLCYQINHTIEKCDNCSYCLSTQHKFNECSKHREKVLSLHNYNIKLSTDLQHIRENKFEMSSLPYFKLPNDYTYPQLYRMKGKFGLDVEKSTG
jgi:hypothetical protein